MGRKIMISVDDRVEAMNIARDLDAALWQEQLQRCYDKLGMILMDIDVREEENIRMDMVNQ